YGGRHGTLPPGIGSLTLYGPLDRSMNFLCWVRVAECISLDTRLDRCCSDGAQIRPGAECSRGAEPYRVNSPVSGDRIGLVWDDACREPAAATMRMAVSVWKEPLNSVHRDDHFTFHSRVVDV